VTVKARLKNFRVSPRKARLVADQIRGKGVEDALAILDLSSKRFSKPMAKLVRSALANAEEKNSREQAGIDIDNLVVHRVTVDQGPSMWRIRARAQGRAAWIQKKTSHIQIVLSEE
jgi:large subunit ribosomal protein L22